MNRKVRAIGRVIALSALVAGTAEAREVVAGWDFSQFQQAGSLTPLGSSVPANYSDYDLTFNAGSGSAAFGTAFFDGTNGSTATATDFMPTAGVMNCERRPVGVSEPLKPAGCAVPNVDGPIRSNKKEPWSVPGAGKANFDEHAVLRSEGQQFQNLLAMQASNNVSVVFKGDLGAGHSAGGWRVSFGARTLSGVGDNGGPLSCDPAGASECTSTVSVEFAPNCGVYSSFGSVNLTSADTRYDVALATGASQSGCVRLGLAPGAGAAQPILDNVAITTLPEPRALLSLLFGAGFLTLLTRRRASRP
jgi:hypothetical protein